ncbi:MAG: ABC transporter substrate-binding protein [bacterium]|nr:ABC transporter substrate-binding protein [bacterium]
MTMTQLSAGVLLAIASFGTASDAATQTQTQTYESPTAFLKNHDARVRAVVLRDPADSLSSAEREQVRTLINEAFDFRELSRQSLGDIWETRTDEERDEFVRVYRGIIERRNLDMFVRYHREGGISYTGEEIAEDGRAVVLAEVPVKKETKVIAYSLYRPLADGQWRIFDLIVDGAGTVDGNRRAWTRFISRNSYEELLERLRKQLASLEEAG